MIGIETDFGKKLVSEESHEGYWKMTFEDFTNLLGSKVTFTILLASTAATLQPEGKHTVRPL